LSNTQSKFKNGFIWESYKSATPAGDVTPTAALNGICNAVGGPNCNGVIPSNQSSEFLV